MTGRDLIVYIMQNHLEERPIFQNGRFLDFMTVKEAAAKFEVGEATIRVWVKMGTFPYVLFGGEIFIPRDATLSKCVDESTLKMLAMELTRKEG